MEKVLVIEDSSDCYSLIRRAMGDQVEWHWARYLRDGYRALESEKFDIILLDLGLPDGDGFQFCSLLKTMDVFKDTPVIFISAKNEVIDRVMGFSVGADDYIGKPFHPDELRSRISTKLRRRRLEAIQASRIALGNLELDTDFNRAWIKEEGGTREIVFTSLEFKIIRYLMSRANEVVTRREIYDKVWGEGFHVYDRSADTHICQLKRKLRTSAGQLVELCTVRVIGLLPSRNQEVPASAQPFNKSSDISVVILRDDNSSRQSHRES